MLLYVSDALKAKGVLIFSNKAALKIITMNFKLCHLIIFAAN